MSYEDCSLTEMLGKWNEDDCGLDKAVMEKFKQRKVLFFLGAGVSRLEGVMGWTEFANHLIEKAFPKLCEQEQLLRNGISSKEKISIAYEKLRGEGKEREFYKEFGEALKPKYDQQTRIYDLLAKFKVNFLTTNADTLFEKILGSEFCHTDFDAEMLFNSGNIPRGQLFYLHGRYTESGEERLVFTAAQYVERYNDNRFCDFLRRVFNEECVIFFIGYGLNEYELIDYIATKVGLKTKGNSSFVYSLEPFFSTQEALFSARRMYFKSLGIEILPYCIDDGYSELKNVIEKMYDVFKSQVCIPIDDCTDILFYINRKCNKAALAYVNRLLEDNPNDGRFGVAFETLQNSVYWRSWGRSVIRNKLWFPNYSEKEYLSWDDSVYKRMVLLNWLITKSSDRCYVLKAKEILDNIVVSSDDSIKNAPWYLIAQYVNCISCLDISLLNDSCFTFITKAFKFHGQQISYIGLDEKNRIVEWNGCYLEKFILSVLNGMPDANDCLFEDFYVDYFEKNAPLNYNDRAIKSFFNAFYDYAKSKIEEDMFNPIFSTSNLDNLDRHHYGVWSSILTKLVFYYEKLNDETKKEYMNRGLESDNAAICKLWLYINRHTITDTSFLLNDDVTCFNYERCMYELYLLIKVSKNNDIDRLKEKIDISSLGVDLKFHSKEYLTRIKNGFKKVLGIKGVDEFDDLERIANINDCVYVSDVSKEDFSNLSLSEAIEKMEGTTSNYQKSIIARIVVQNLFKLQKEQLGLELERLGSLNDDSINLIMIEVRMQDKNMKKYQKDIFCVYALTILQSNRSNSSLVKHCFALLAYSDLTSIYEENRTLLHSCLMEWGNRWIDKSIDTSRRNDIVARLINTVEFERVSFICNYWVTVKSNKKDTCDSDLFECVKVNSQYNVSKWCLSFRFYEIAALLGKDKISDLIQVLVFGNKNDNPDYMAAILIVHSMKSILEEVCDLVVSLNLLSEKDRLNNIDEAVKNSIYRYCAVAYFCEKIKLSDIVPALSEEDFYDALFLYLNSKVNKHNEIAIQKFVSELWTEIKKQIQINVKLQNRIFRLMTPLFSEKNIDVGLINIAIEILSVSEVIEDFYIDGNGEKVINVLKQHPNVGKDFVRLYFKKCKYISSIAIENIIKYLAKTDVGFAEKMIVVLHDNNKIAIDFYEKLHNIIHPNSKN